MQRAIAGITRMFDELPIVATQIGFRVDSSESEQAFGKALFAVVERWAEVKPQ